MYKKGGRLGGEGAEGGKTSAGVDPGRRTRTSELPVRRAGETPASERAGEQHDQLAEGGLSAEERLLLIIDTRSALGEAYTAFGDACQQERLAVKEAVEAGHGVLGLLFDVAMGLLLPGLLDGIAHALSEIASASPELAGRLARAFGPEEPAIFRETLLEATGSALEHAKSASPADTTEIDAYLTHLAVTFHKATIEIGEGLSSKPDSAIAVVCASFHPGVTNQAAYSAAIHDLVQKYKKTVEPIGRAKDGHRGSGDWRVEWTDTMAAYTITDGAALTGMALVERRERGDSGERRYRLVRWIPPELHDAARGKMRALTGGEMETLPISEVAVGAW